MQANFSRANLHSAQFVGANLAYTNFEHASLEKAVFKSAKLEGADFRGSHLSWAHFGEADLRGANFSYTVLDFATLDVAILNGANFQGADLHKAGFWRSQLENANLRGANLSGGIFEGANLNGANLNGANLSGANFIRANLARVDLTDTTLNRTDFNGADFPEANLSGLVFSGVSIPRANLWNANLQGARISHSDLSFVNLQGANLTGTVFDSNIMPGINLRDATIDATTDFRSIEAWFPTWHDADLGSKKIGHGDTAGSLKQPNSGLPYAVPSQFSTAIMDERVRANLMSPTRGEHVLTSLTLLQFESPVTPKLSTGDLPSLMRGAYLAKMHLPRANGSLTLARQVELGTVLLVPTADATDASGRAIPGAAKDSLQAHQKLGKKGIFDSFNDPENEIAYTLKPRGAKDAEGREVYELDTQSYSVNDKMDAEKLGFAPLRTTKRNPNATRPYDVFLPESVAREIAKRLEKDFPDIRVVLSNEASPR